MATVECPNSTCAETFPSAEEVFEHLSNPNAPCVQHTITATINALFPPGADAGFSYDDLGQEEDDGIYSPILRLLHRLIEPLFTDDYYLDSYDEDANISHDDLVNVDQLNAPAPTSPHLPQEIPPVASQIGLRRIDHPHCPISRPGGHNLLETMDLDQHADNRKTNLFYPFADKMDWEVARFIHDTSLTQQQIDRFLKLDYVRV